MSQPCFIKRKEMMEYYFSGTIERIIFENPSSFFSNPLARYQRYRCRRLLMILRLLWRVLWADIMEGRRLHLTGGSWSIILNTENSSKSVAMSVPNPLARAWWNIFQRSLQRNWSQNSPEDRGPLWGRYHWQNSGSPWKIKRNQLVSPRKTA